MKIKILSLWMYQTADFDTLDFLILIARKNWVTEKFCDFCTVHETLFVFYTTTTLLYILGHETMCKCKTGAKYEIVLVKI